MNTDWIRNGVSVLLPTVAVDDWLDEAVNSLLSETALTYEVIVIHDGIRPDPHRSWFHDQRVKCIHIPERSGLGNALNVGAKAALYPYLARLDADDLSLPSRLAIQARFLDEHPEVVLIGSPAFLIDESGRVKGEFGQVSSGDVRFRLLLKNVLIHSSVMFRAHEFNYIGQYNSSMRQSEDYDLWLRLSQLGELHVLDHPMVKYRMHSGQMSGGSSPYQDYITTILASRKKLSRQMHQRAIVRFRNDVAWWSAQVLRYHGLRRLGYVRDIRD